MFVRNEESIEKYNKKFESLKKTFGLVALGLTMTGSLYANDINVQQDHLRNITNNSNIELNQNNENQIQQLDKVDTTYVKTFRSELNKDMNRWYDSEKDSENFTTIDKMKYLVAKSTLDKDFLSDDQISEKLENYKKLFDNMKVTLPKDRINEFNENITTLQKNKILNNDDKILDKVNNLNSNSKGLNIDDRENLKNLKTFAEAINFDSKQDFYDNSVLSDDDKVLMLSILANGCDLMENKINDNNKKDKDNNIIKDQDNKSFLVEIEEESTAMDILR